MATPTVSRQRVARHRAAQHARGLRAVVLWLPNTDDPAFRAQLKNECRRLARLTADEELVAEEFEELASGIEGWQ